MLTSLQLAHADQPASTQGELPRGTVLERRLDSDPTQRYYLYVPHSAEPGARLLVTVHGVSRNAEEHARRFSRRAERYGVVLVAPLFDEHRFRDYQRLGRDGLGPRADAALDRILAEVGRLTGARTHRFHLFGYSGGGQFAHRYTLAYPERVEGLAIGAAGWYTFPTRERRYPLGIGGEDRLPGVSFDPDRFLKVPACVLVGERDVKRDAELNGRRRIDRQQGANRLQRGRRWVKAMRTAARARGLDTRYRFEVLPEAGHSFTHSMRRGKMGSRVFRFLFGRPPMVAGAPHLRLVSSSK